MRYDTWTRSTRPGEVDVIHHRTEGDDRNALASGLAEFLPQLFIGLPISRTDGDDAIRFTDNAGRVIAAVTPQGEEHRDTATVLQNYFK